MRVNALPPPEFTKELFDWMFFDFAFNVYFETCYFGEDIRPKWMSAFWRDRELRNYAIRGFGRSKGEIKMWMRNYLRTLRTEERYLKAFKSTREPNWKKVVQKYVGWPTTPMRVRTLEVKLIQEEMNLLEAKAKEEGLTPKDFIRKLIEREVQDQSKSCAP